MFSSFFNCVLHCCSWLLVLYWMGCLRIEHHLAAKFWTKPSAFAAYVIFTVCGWFTFWGVFFWGVFYCAIFIICWWYSFYKNLMWGAPVVASSATGTSCPLFCSFCRANCAAWSFLFRFEVKMRIIIVLTLLVWILFFMIIGVLCFLFFFFYCVSHCCSWLLVLYWTGCLRIEHLLAAKFWTKPSAFAAYVIFTVGR